MKIHTETSDPPPNSSVESSLASDPLISAIIAGMGEGFFALDASWRFVAFNPAAEAIFGIARAEVVGRLIWEVSPAIIGTELERRYRLVMADRQKQEFASYSALRPDRYHEVRAFPLGDGMGVSFRDISNRQRANQALIERQAELTRVQRIGGVGGMEVNLRDGFRSRRSPEYLHLHGLPKDTTEDNHQDWVRRLHPDDRIATEEHFLNVVASEESHYTAEYRIVRPNDGAVRWIRAVAEIERDTAGNALKLVGAHLDITNLKEAEHAAQSNERHLRSIADALPLMISYVDRDQYFRFANKQYEIWFDRPLDEIVGKRISEVMGPEVYHARKAFVERALAGETLSYEVDFPGPLGLAFTEVSHVPHFGEDGGVRGFYAVVRDITERKSAEKLIRESEERFRSIANSAPVPIWVTRPDGRRAFVNTAYMNFLGCSFDEALNFDWRNSLHPGDISRILAEQKVGESSLRPFALEARYRRGDGQWRWLRSESQPRLGPAGEHTGFIGVAHDVTDSKQAEEKLTLLNETLERQVEERSTQLAATEALIRTFFDHSTECHAVLVEANDGKFRYKEVNPATLRLYNKSRKHVIDKTTIDVLGEEKGSEIDRHLALSLGSGFAHRYERMQGDRVIEAVVSPVPYEEGAARRLVVSAHDITERRRLEEQLRQAQKMEVVGQLTGGVAHDFNNLLTLVLGGLEVIGRQIPNLPASEALARIERARGMALQGVNRAAALTSRLLAFSRQQALDPQPIDANSLVSNTCELLRRTLGETISLETVLAAGLWGAFVDPNHLENALINLALNARDAMPNGGRLTIETAKAFLDRAYVTALSEPVVEGEYVMIAVSDSGVGMDSATLARAFDPFFTTKDVGKGTGLGLSQVYGFARQSQGHVKIYSELGEGTTVRIYLPRSSEDSLANPTDASTRLESKAGTESILVVEDDETLRTFTSESLLELGYRVFEANNGANAVSLLSTIEHLDLLLTDVVMPGGVNGRELAEIALAQRPTLKVLFMTGYTRNAIIHHGRLDEGVHVIGKPFSFQELAAKVRVRLDAKE